MSKNIKIILIILVAIIFIGAGVWIGLIVSGNTSSASGLSASPYSAVYLSTGDVYFGKLDWFPSPHLEDAWFLQRTTDANGNPTVAVYPFGQVAWGPTDIVYFNSQQIIFWTRLATDSNVVKIMENPTVPTPTAQPDDLVPSSTPTMQIAPTSTTSTIIVTSTASSTKTK
jgi:hypothetical protein